MRLLHYFNEIHTDTVNGRLIYVVRNVITVLIIGLCYHIFTLVTHLYIPCVFRMLTGLKCPGCGISHMAQGLLALDLRAAYEANQFLFILLPFAFVYAVYRAVRFILHNDRTYTRAETAAIFVTALCTVVFGIGRNLV